MKMAWAPAWALALAAALHAADLVAVDPAGEALLKRRLLPLPRQVSVPAKLVLSPAEVSIAVPPDAGEVEKQAAAELRGLFARKAGAAPDGGGFRILLGTVDAAGKVLGEQVEGLDRLRGAPNNGQAYRIHPVGERALLLAGLSGRGVWNAAATLRQLLEPSLAPDCVEAPLAEVLDWPEFEERGLWNYPFEWTPLLAGLKLNFGKLSSRPRMIERGKPNAMEPGFLASYLEARRMGFNATPSITHLNFLESRGLFRAYPELAGVGDGALAGRYPAHKQGRQHRAPCASHPLLTRILAEWMEDFASQGVAEISCWLTERPAQCGCEDCMATGQFTLEARAFVNAWRQVRERRPGFGIRLFLSTTATVDNFRVLAETPAEVKIERACATVMERAVRVPRDLLRNPLLDSYAAEGRWMATYDVPLNVNGAVDTPEFKLPHSSARRVRWFLDQMRTRKYRGVYGMMAWSRFAWETCAFNIAALAEWSWNPEGRSEREFALAWALRNGCERPEAFADWAEIMGPVEFDVFDSGFPECYARGLAVEMVARRQRPRLGEGMFRYYETPGAFARKLEACGRALEIAASLGDAQLVHETTITRGFVALAKAVYDVAEFVSRDDLRTLESQDRVRELLAALRGAGQETATSIAAWRASLGPEPWHPRVRDAIAAVEDTARRIATHVEWNWLY